MTTERNERHAKDKFVITGMGVVSAIGIGLERFSSMLRKGTSGEKELSLFNGRDAELRTACQIHPFDYQAVLGNIKSRYLDRSTLLGLTAMQLAFDTGAVPPEKQKDFGVVIGSAFGSLWSAGDYTRDMFSKGPMSINPMKFPNTVMNSPASQINIRFGQKLLSSTITTGFTASLDAVAYGMNQLEMAYCDAVAVGGVEELSPDEFLGFKLSGYLAGKEKAIPFDRASEGCLLGEAGVMMLLERESHAVRRGAPVFAEVGGYGFSFDPSPPGRIRPGHRGPLTAMCNALSSAGMQPGEVGLISAGANGNRLTDKLELKAVQELADRGFEGRITSIKSLTGECYGASGALQMAAAIVALRDGVISPVRNFERSWEPGLDSRIAADTVTKDISTVMINNTSSVGYNASLILRRHTGARN